jgi:AraC-like DNA-binding protein
VLDRLLDVVLVGVLREHFGRAGAGAPPWYRALDDPQVGRALRALHADPARPWTVAALAAEVGLSRAAFARRFTALVGEPPLEYLTGWRMALAREQLRETRDGLAAVARAVGYGSEFAFAAAFKRHHGVAPGRWRTLDRPPAREVIGA